MPEINQDFIDTIATIDELIEEVRAYISASKRDKTPSWTLVYEMQEGILKELKSRLSLKI